MPGSWNRKFAFLLFGAVFAASQMLAQSTDQSGKQSKEFDLGGDKKWLDTGIDLKPGDTLKLTATGTLRYLQSKENGPDGLPRGWKDLMRTFPLNDANRGALLGRIGSSDAARPFLVGVARESRAPAAGRLFLGLNQTDNDRPEGNFHVKIEVTQSAAQLPADTSRLPVLTQSMLDELPVRVVDAKGNPGDRVNFLILGSEDVVKRALQAAGWVAVNRSVKDAFLQGAFATFSRQAYTQLPMSELQLFGRSQDFGYAMADPLMVVAARHHFRIWKAPFSVEGRTLWAGAGTHDIGFDKDQRNGSITHKIDPDTDKERDFIGSSLDGTGEVAKLLYMSHKDTITEAKTAHGEAFRTDGRTLLVILKEDQNNRSEAFSDLFCSILQDKNPDGGEWGDCSRYLEIPSKKHVDLTPISTRYRLLIVPGLMNTCFGGAAAYKEGQAYLKEKYGMTVDLLPVPNNSCEDNARQISDFLQEKMKADTRKYIVLGYSKGAPDLQVALAIEPAVSQAIAALISVAGASGGSPIADSIPGLADRWISQYSLPNCQGNLTQGFKSLSQSARRAFLSRYPNPLVPTYSLPAVSDKDNTSKILMQTWQLLSLFGGKQDSQLTKSDAIIPGSVYLGAALADHFAVALPFETSTESIRSGADRNHYPRTALLEAMVRFVIQDLEAAGTAAK